MNDALTRPQTLREGLESLEYVGAPESIKAGALLGPYRLTKLLGEGGMGAVWLADQLEPFERKVAIKFAHTAASSQNQAYLEVERQALARMVHPYIAQIYDAGATAHGAMFFVMEYVEGVELEQQLAQPTSTKRVDVRLRDAVKLMRKICEGAHYAHQRGLIHRDLKPSNVLVGQLANEAIPKIIDFGIAVGMDPDRGSAQAGTAGTLAYMAPEQLKPTAEGIDVRADVHALGVILVELLSHAQGKRVHLEQAISVREILATRQKSAADEHRVAPQSQLQRRQRAAAAIALIPRELRAIARKATAEDRNQRFESAAAMADDLQRWLDRRPVQAMDQGRWYAFRCFVNRYRIASALGALTLAALVIGLVVASYGLSEARTARALADARREQAEGLIGYMLGDFSTKLESIGKFELFDGVATRALEYLRQANDQDAVSATHRATALRTIGDIQMRRGQLDAAKATFLLANAAMEQAEGFGTPTSAVLFERAQVAFWLGNRAFVERDFVATKSYWKDYLGYAQKMEQLKPGDSTAMNEVASAKINLGVVAFETNDLPFARESFQGAVVLLKGLSNAEPDNTLLLESLADAISWKAKVEDESGYLMQAKDSYLEQLAVQNKLVEKNKESTSWKDRYASTKHLAALTLLQLGQSEKAVTMLEGVAKDFESLVAAESENFDMRRRLATCYSNISWLYYVTGQAELARENIIKSLDIFGVGNDSAKSSQSWRLSRAIAFQRAWVLLPPSAATQRYADDATTNLHELLKFDASNIKVYVALVSGVISGADKKTDVKFLQQVLEKQIQKRKSAEVLDSLYRIYVLTKNNQGAELIKLQLMGMGYNSPEFINFTTKNILGANK